MNACIVSDAPAEPVEGLDTPSHTGDVVQSYLQLLVAFEQKSVLSFLSMV